jgi:hypothetical protein
MRHSGEHTGSGIHKNTLGDSGCFVKAGGQAFAFAFKSLKND